MFEEWVRNVDDRIRHRHPWVKANAVLQGVACRPEDEGAFCEQLESLIREADGAFFDRHSSSRAIVTEFGARPVLTAYLARVEFDRTVIDPDTAPYLKFVGTSRLCDYPLTSDVLLSGRPPAVPLGAKLSFRREKQDLARTRAAALSQSFNQYATIFDSERLFTGPSFYFHHKTIAIPRSHGGSIERCLRDDHFLESLYATLTAWGLHRMGSGNTKLVEFSTFQTSLREVTNTLCQLENVRIERVGPLDFARIVETLWTIIATTKVGTGSTKLVAGSKALHHVLPDLVPPVDREYTVRFFFDNKNAIQGSEVRQADAFKLIYSHFVAICHNKRTEIEARLGIGMNTSCTKTVDNAIVGYCRQALNVTDDAGEN